MLQVKRLLLMVASLAVCLALYQVYVLFLGGYDGLTPLPPEFWPAQTMTPANSLRDTPNPEPPVVRKLRQAFGPQAKEADRPILIESVQHGIILAAQKVFLSKEGKLELEQVSVAIFGKKRWQGEPAEISTIQGDRAVIEFDKPLTSVRDVANRKPVAGRIEGSLDPTTGKTNQVHLRYNRRSTNPDDDLHLYCHWLQYDDRQHRIWTESAVEIIDGDPDSGKITGIGLEVQLATETPSKPGAKPGRPAITGVRRVEISRNVQMYFQLAAGAALLGGAANPAKTPSASGKDPVATQIANGSPDSSQPPGQASQKLRRSPVKVLADGPFLYDVPEDRAEFHHRVHLIRIVPGETRAHLSQRLDEVRCQMLTLQFRRQPRQKKPRAQDNDSAVELVAARALGEPVEVVLESENLQARGTELVLDRTSNSATLVGKPVEAIYDGHRLQITGNLVLRAEENQLRELRDAQGRGPGTAWLRGRQGNATTLIVRWREQMQLQREGSIERLLLSGNVLLEEPQRGSLRADHLLIWLEAVPEQHVNGLTGREKSEASPAAEQPPVARFAPGPQSQKEMRGRIPRCLEASGNVSLQSETLVIPHTERLRVELHDPEKTGLGQSGGPKTPPADQTDSTARSLAAKPGAGPNTPGTSPGQESAPTPISPIGQPEQPLAGATAPSSTSGEANAPTAPPARRSPLVLRARTIEAIAVGSPTRAELQSVSAQEQVQIEQPATSPQDRALQIRCALLRLTRTAFGDILRLEGTPAQPASVQLGPMALRGPIIKLDQVLNTVDVEGLGSMRLPARNDFQGNPLREPAEVVVDWNQSMFFDGRLAEFDGGVQAVQGNSRLACRRLSLLLDRKISLRENKNTDLKRNEPPAALSRLMCEQDVRLEKVVVDGERYRMLQRIEARELAYDHELATLTAYGPGSVIVFQPAGEAPRGIQSSVLPQPARATPPSQTTPPAGSGTNFKLTHIRYDGYLQASKAADKQTDVISFAGGVQLLYLSAQDPDQPVDPDRLPDDGLSLSCGQLKITSSKLENSGSAQELLAEHSVRVRAKQFHALADRVSFDEAKDLLILEGASGATLYRQRVPGGEFEPVRAKRIWFWRRDNRVRFDGTESIQINP